MDDFGKWIALCTTFLILALVLLLGIFRPEAIDATIAFLGVFSVVALWGVLSLAALLLLLFGGIVAYGLYNRTLRAVDGQMALQHVRLGHGRTAIVDPNALFGPGVIIDRRAGTLVELPVTDVAAQSHHRDRLQATRTAGAVFRGDIHGARSEQPRVNGGVMRQLFDSKPQKQLPLPVVDVAQTPAVAPLALPVRADTPDHAAVLATPTMLPVGTDTDTGKTVFWDVATMPHIRVHGASQGSGKTNLLRTVAVFALRQDWHVLGIDRWNFKDWTSYSGRIEEIWSADPDLAIHAVRALAALHTQRQRALAEANVKNFAQLGQSAGKRILVIISEFGNLLDNANGALLRPLQMLLRESATTGIHFGFEDQSPQGWPRALIVNASPMTGYMPMSYGVTGGYYDAHKLRPYEFHGGGTTFRTWDMDVAAPALLAAAPRLNGFRVVPDRPAHAERTPNASDERAESTLTAWDATPPDRPGRWDNLVAQWFAEHPQALTGPAEGISDIARLMADADGGDYNVYKSTASAYFHAFRNAVRLSNGDRLGTDISH